MKFKHLLLPCPNLVSRSFPVSQFPVHLTPVFSAGVISRYPPGSAVSPFCVPCLRLLLSRRRTKARSTAIGRTSTPTPTVIPAVAPLERPGLSAIEVDVGADASLSPASGALNGVIFPPN